MRDEPGIKVTREVNECLISLFFLAAAMKGDTCRALSSVSGVRAEEMLGISGKLNRLPN